MTRRLLALAFTAFVALTLWAQEAQKREMRTVWIATVSNIDWPQTRGTGTATINKQKKQLTDLLDGFVKANMNSVCLQVRPMADALYKSSYEPWSSYLTGTRGQDPGWDPLAFAVEECHKRGLEINAWVNPYRFSNSSGNDCTTAIDQNLKNSGILMQVGNRIVFNPALKASRDHLLKVCKEMIQNYDIDGIIFDDYFYPGGGTPEDSSAPDYQLYTQSNSGMSIGDWRRANVNQMVKDMWDMVQATKPYVKFSIGPAGVAGQRSTSATKHGVVPVDEYCRASDWQYTTIYSDPLAWLEEGTIDYISPQLYWKTNHTTNPFGPLTNWWSYIAEHFGRHHYASHNIYFMEKTNTKADWDEILQQIRYSRQYNRQNAPGVNFYSAKYIDGPTCKGFADYLSQTLFTHKSLEPAMPWHSKTNYDAPANLAYSGGTLSWTGVNKKLVRYSVYAVPLTVTLDEAQSQAFDGIKSDYLVGVTYTPSFKLDASLQSGYWYAVCVVDGWNNEFAPAFYNLATEYADKVTLVSPIAGTAATWNQQFAWTAADDATYELQISDDATFGNVLIQRKQIISNTTTIDLGDLASGQTYYWRVATLQPNRIVMWSDAATFKAPVRTPAEAVALVSPANGASFDADFVFKFTPVTAHSFKLDASLQSGYWYAVCVVDGWNNEFAPAFYNLATEYADKVTLVSPIAGTAATWNQQFAWTAADGATYELQISDDASFGNVLIQRKQITSNSATVDLGDLASGQTYYWRVATLQPNRLVMWSDAATFKAPVRTPAEAVTLVSPANGASFDADFVFKFTPVTAHSFKLQVSKTADFAHVAYETTDFATAGNQLSANCVVSVLGKGTFYWRVVSSRK
ncbi:MAG: family 10 glycosylhydrolase, partial [Bacteroidales bacterium]|nr:family 10 glycosylhydrolase [Bacteroidales bacterium]